ncbi:MAG: COQ9 family protein [Rhodobacteraceae bacterium]|nr:COQ9 family protein [Paracoccaceae bacterium]
MSKPGKTEEDHIEGARAVLLDAAMIHVMFDGWGPETLAAAISDSGVDAGLAAQVCPRGAIDLAVAFHKRGDAQMVAALQARDMDAIRFRDRIARGVRLRLEAVAMDREAVRRGATLFALPHNASDGAALIWGTCDLIWNTLGDTSQDVNWYTKRATLSAVYSATVLFWLGDESADFTDTWAFLDRRIDNVMQFETLKANLRKNPLVKGFMAGPGRILDSVKAPGGHSQTDLPGHISNKG